MSFKAEPIIYKFYPDSDNKNLWIQTELFKHNHGYGITFSIIEKKFYKYQDGEYIVYNEKDFKRNSMDFWDNQLKSQELSELIYFLGCGEIIGKYVEIVIWRLFLNLYFNEGAVERYFPKYYNYQIKLNIIT